MNDSPPLVKSVFSIQPTHAPTSYLPATPACKSSHKPVASFSQNSPNRDKNDGSGPFYTSTNPRMTLRSPLRPPLHSLAFSVEKRQPPETLDEETLAKHTIQEDILWSNETEARKVRTGSASRFHAVLDAFGVSQDVSGQVFRETGATFEGMKPLDRFVAARCERQSIYAVAHPRDVTTSIKVNREDAMSTTSHVVKHYHNRERGWVKGTRTI